MFIARRLRAQIGEQHMVGLLLPPSVGGALTNYALMLMGRVPVNLNYTSSSEVIAGCAPQCGLDVVITSKAFLERFPNMEIPGRTILLEEALAGPRLSEKLTARGDGVVDAGRVAQADTGRAKRRARRARKPS